MLMREELKHYLDLQEITGWPIFTGAKPWRLRHLRGDCWLVEAWVDAQWVNFGDRCWHLEELLSIWERFVRKWLAQRNIIVTPKFGTPLVLLQAEAVRTLHAKEQS
jgi:hypothetical protein